MGIIIDDGDVIPFSNGGKTTLNTFKRRKSFLQHLWADTTFERNGCHAEGIQNIMVAMKRENDGDTESLCDKIKGSAF